MAVVSRVDVAVPGTNVGTPTLPYWVNQSTACGAVSFPGGDSLSLTRQAGCMTDAGSSTTAGIAALAPQWVLCGDFDIAVEFDAVSLPVTTAGWDSASIRAFDPGTTPEDPLAPTHNGMSVERANDQGWTSAPQAYKSYTTDSSDNASVHLSTADTSGRLRITRVGTAVTGACWTSSDAGAPDAGGWVVLNTATLPAVPWTVRLYVAGGGQTVALSVLFSGFTSSP